MWWLRIIVVSYCHRIVQCRATAFGNTRLDKKELRAACTEENELLNTTSVKMTEAPFGSGRSDSDEDDIVEDYDESVSFKTPCLRDRTPLERFLLLVLLVCLVVIIGLAVGLTRPQIVPDSDTPSGGTSFDKTRALYRSCMEATPERRQQILDQFSSILESIGGWSLSANDSLDHWTFMVGLEKVHKLGVWPFFKLKVEVDEREPTKSNIIKSGSINIFISIFFSRDLRDYLALSVLRSFKQYFERDIFEIKNTEEDSIDEPWKRCTFYTNKAMGFSTGAMYVKSTGSEDGVKNMERLITFVKIAFKDHLLHKFWMDKDTQKRAEKKVDAIIDKISYPSYILNDTFLDKYYEKLVVVPHDWLANLASWRKFLLGAMNSELKAVPDRKTSWLRPPVTVNAFYSATRNDVIFPIAMFHLPFYIPDGPGAVNFGAMGSIIGHEITHAFDIQGSSKIVIMVFSTICLVVV
ncbi:endothelin-converting enzyme 1 [Elysia marginata]|uniref:Endothelin-converting enzyme 1 n=1 Tax=Elysia marginata TaxID=1093978 RepID=A0AAV4GIU7_9GAST|nr:endothelin-converting enzyme 1 [Elysia marginata]